MVLLDSFSAQAHIQRKSFIGEDSLKKHTKKRKKILLKKLTTWLLIFKAIYFVALYYIGKH